MTRIDTAKARRIHATADDMKHGDCHTARAVLTGMMPNMLNELDRLQAENQRLREAVEDKAAPPLTCSECGDVLEVQHTHPLVGVPAREIRPCEECRMDYYRLAEEAGEATIRELRKLNRRALAIIADAIMHGMPITEEVAAVRNGIVCGHESPKVQEAGE